MFFYEASVGSHISWENKKDNGYRSDIENSCQEQKWKKTYLLKEKNHTLWQHHKYMVHMKSQEI